ncbi:cytochrome d ubiquinol oxidase subunit II [Kurthia sibirica]|uniref:Cytochrome D ubiquinol oxidase subunit II n=1 Tax=Kurthia sibirica TaxID=202750 RepID=A0A2U3AL52_9BACL|nr:cytochrome d ubiquinol oxidase subunit II [Kurthia sibirica]PWI25257.1 cytochrome D ubiquinol oxidase subunit II [Kurthia sibirica]GEK33759.1 cytochrome D ubiquinol oxidase subunit II [Kurthia sibirica]
MNIEILGISVLWIFLFGYIIVGSIDFGAGFFNAYGILTNKQRILSTIIQRYLSPVWEVTNVFFVFFFVGIIGFFPKTAVYFGQPMLIPGSIILILLCIRGSYYAFESYGTKGHKGYATLYGASGVLIPAALSITLTISEGGFVSIGKGGPELDFKALFTSPLTWSVVVLSISACLFISATFLTWYANKANDLEARELLKKYAFFWAIPLVVAVIGIMVELRSHNPLHYNRMMDMWYLLVLSALMFIGTIYLLWSNKKFGVAIGLVIGQFLFAFFAYGIGHYPYLMYPHLTIYDSFTNQSMAIALVVTFVLGLLLLLPALWLIMKLFIFNKDYAKGKNDTHV